MIPLLPQQLAYFRAEIERADQVREDRLAAWGVDGNLERYAPKDVHAHAGEVNVGADFRDVERKKAALFYDTPSVSLTPQPDGHVQAAQLHGEVLNTLLSPQRMDAGATALKAIQACLVAIQPALTQIGYTSVVVDGQVVHEGFFWSHVSAKATLLPHDLRDTHYDQSPWIGYRWRKPASYVRRAYGVPPAVELPGSDGAHRPFFTEDTQPSDGANSDDPMVSGVYLEYKAAAVDPNVQHPEVVRVLVLVDGMDAPLVHKDAPWQTFDPMTGGLTPDSVEGYSLHPLALRDLPDSGWVPSDSTITGPLTEELNKFRSQVIQKRDSNTLLLLADIEKIDIDALERIQSVPALKKLGFSVVPVQGGALQQGVNSVLTQVPTLTLGRETYEGQDRIERDREQILGIAANQTGAQTQTKRTATELSIVQRNSEARFEQERLRVLAWWLRGVQKLSALVVRYGDRIAADILGAPRAQQWLQFRQQGFLGPFTFDVQIDGGRYLDIEANRRQWVQLYNLTGRDPHTNRVVILQKLAEVFGLDPSWVIPQLPPKGPEPPKVSITLSGEDFDPALRRFPIIVDIARQGGWTISEQAVQLAQQMTVAQSQTGTGDPDEQPEDAQSMVLIGPRPKPAAGAAPNPRQTAGPPPHGGPMPAGELLNKHQAGESGALPGPGPM